MIMLSVMSVLLRCLIPILLDSDSLMSEMAPTFLAVTVMGVTLRDGFLMGEGMVGEGMAYAGSVLLCV